MTKHLLSILIIYLLLSFDSIAQQNQPFLVVLGTVQDAGSPHAGCVKVCCADLFDNPDPNRMVVSLGVVDPANEQTWLFDATPDLHRQMKLSPVSASASRALLSPMGPCPSRVPPGRCQDSLPSYHQGCFKTTFVMNEPEKI